MPIWNWARVYEDLDLTYLYTDSQYYKRKIDAKETTRLHKAWNDLYLQYIDRFHTSEEDVAKLNLDRLTLLNKIKAYLSEDKTKRIIAKASEDSNSGQKKPKKNITFIESLAVLERKLGQINPHIMCVEMYYTHVNQLNVEIDYQKKQQAKWQKNQSSRPK